MSHIRRWTTEAGIQPMDLWPVWTHELWSRSHTKQKSWIPVSSDKYWRTKQVVDCIQRHTGEHEVWTQITMSQTWLVLFICIKNIFVITFQVLFYSYYCVQAGQWFQAAEKTQRIGRASEMDSSRAESVHYNRWNEDNINMNVEASQSTVMRWDEVTLWFKHVVISVE